MARVVVLGVLCALSEGLEVRTRAPPLVLVHGDALLPCYFTFPEAVRAQDVAVKWTLRPGGGGPLRPVYTFDGVNMNVLRPESSIDPRLLESGNASLHLPGLRLEDEGDYTCTVLISPEVADATLTLRLAAQPAVSLLPEEPHFSRGEMKTFICKLRHFYPQDLQIRWMMKRKEEEAELTKEICTGVPYRADNGTFTADSQLSIVFSEEDDGSAILCEVKHPSLPQPLRTGTSIHLTVVQAPGSVVLVLSTLVTVTAFILAFALFYWKILASVPPRVSALILPELNMAGEEMVAICNINGFRPKAVEICWYIEKAGESAWSAGGGAELLLQATDVTDHATHPVTKHGSLCNCTSQLAYTPCVQDDGARLVCVVRHKALGTAAWRESPINVAVRPKKSYISSWPQEPRRGEALTLSCIVERFYPKPIAVTWLRNGQAQSGITQFGPFPCDGDYYSVWSQTGLTLTEEEDGAVYTCQIRHLSLRSLEELSYEINAQGTPPKVQFIVCDPATPTIGQEVTLSCRISNFFPRDITVDWSKDGVRLRAGVHRSLCVTNSTGVHSMCSFLKVTPAAEDDGSIFTCAVQHAALKNREERSYTLSVAADNLAT